MKPGIKKIQYGLISMILIFTSVTMMSLTYTYIKQQRFSDINTLVIDWNNQTVGLEILGFDYSFAPSERRYQRWKDQYASMAALIERFSPYSDRYQHIPVITNLFQRLPATMDKIHTSALQGKIEEQLIFTQESNCLFFFQF